MAEQSYTQISTDVDNGLVVQWGDLLIASANHRKEILKTSLRPLAINRAFDISVEEMEAFERSELATLHSSVTDGLDFNQQKDTLEKYREAIYKHLLNAGYIYEQKPAQDFWLLNDTGMLVKELKGHLNYLKYRDREINPSKHQFRRDLKLALITGAITLAVGVLLWLIDNQSKLQQQEQLQKRLDRVEKKLNLPIGQE